MKEFNELSSHTDAVIDPEHELAIAAETMESARGFGRRSFITKTAMAGAAMLLPTLGLAAGKAARQTSNGPTAGDIDILYFLAAAELVEDDLWSQYTELAQGNPRFRQALQNIDVALPAYITQDRNDERSHALLINAYLQSIGKAPLNLDGFRTIMPPKVEGLAQKGRLTNLTNLTVDTSWYNRYRGTGNPDEGDTFPQLLEIVNRPTIPLSDNMSDLDFQLAAHSAAFHFGAIEQGGGSLYNHLISTTLGRDPLSIVAGIGPTEFYHFGVFQTSLEGLFPLRGKGLQFPNLKGNPELSQMVMPGPCEFLNSGFPLCSCVRPRSKANAGAVAAATGLVNSGLFEGQTSAFFNAVVGLAVACDAANGF